MREAKGRKLGGVPFTYGPLAYLLKNRTYLGETGHKGVWFRGEHKAIIDQRTFEQVQDLREIQFRRPNRQTASEWRSAHRPALRRQWKSDEPELHRQSGVRYCFYVSSALLKGRKSHAGSRTRISSDVVEGAVVRGLREHLPELVGQSPQDIQVAVSHRNQPSCSVMRTSRIVTLRSEAGEECSPPKFVFHGRPHPARRSQVDEPACAEAHPNQQFLQALVRAHSWVKLLPEGRHQSVDVLESRGPAPKVIRSGIRLAFLDPTITKALLQGEQAPTLCMKDFGGPIPFSWPEQRAQFAGF